MSFHVIFYLIGRYILERQVKGKTMKKASITILLLVALLCTSASSKSYMKKFKKSFASLKELAKAKKYKDAKFKKSALLLQKEAKKMAKYKHKDEAFNDMNADMQETLKDLNESLKGKDYDLIKEDYEAVAETCQNCHYKYKKKKK